MTRKEDKTEKTKHPMTAPLPETAETIVRVTLTTSLPFVDGALTYRMDVSQAAMAEPGQLVSAPLGKRQVNGMIIETNPDIDPDDKAITLKTAIPYDPAFRLTPEMQKFLHWVAHWYMEPPGAIFKMSVSVPSALAPEVMPTGYQVIAQPDQASTPRRRNILTALSDMAMLPQSAVSIHSLTGASTSTIKAMVDEGLLQEVPMAVPSSASLLHLPDRKDPLTPEQTMAANHLTAAIDANDFKAFVLDGVTGSGKTEVYFEAVAAALQAGRQALILLPEIALSQAFEKRCLDRFGFRPRLWHSGLSEAKRRTVWRDAIKGEPMVVAGARSALFLPFSRPGVIVVDEEHDHSFRQQDGVRYHARDMAVVRAKLSRIPVILSSATPSLETLVNAEQGKYEHIQLTSRFGKAEMPEITLIDLGKTPTERRRWLAPPLVEAIGKALQNQEQILLFLNRRGYAPMSLCLSCRERIVCPNCSAWLVTHKSVGQLRCHHCGHSSRFPEQCPSCGVADMIMPCGPGVERLAEEVALRFPDARQGIFSSDLITTPAMAETFFDAVHNGEMDIIIGTQMIAKGHHFPGLTLVGVVDADLGLSGGDLRGGELSWQMLTQVAGRAGRAEKIGRVLMQTAMPEARVLQSLVNDDRAGFIAAEKADREAANMPPYGRLAAVILSSRDIDRLMTVASQMATQWPNYDGLTLLGPAPAPIRLLRGQHRMRFLIKAERQVNLQRAMAQWLNRVKIPSSIQCQLDIDPVSFF
jgi:primosomal protein N' (replication factor Y)